MASKWVLQTWFLPCIVKYGWQTGPYRVLLTVYASKPHVSRAVGNTYWLGVLLQDISWDHKHYTCEYMFTLVIAWRYHILVKSLSKGVPLRLPLFWAVGRGAAGTSGLPCKWWAGRHLEAYLQQRGACHFTEGSWQGRLAWTRCKQMHQHGGRCRMTQRGLVLQELPTSQVFPSPGLPNPGIWEAHRARGPCKYAATGEEF